MKNLKYLLLSVLLSAVFVLPGYAGNLNVSGRAGMYTPTQLGASPTLMYGLSADYALNSNLSVRAAYDTTTYTLNNIQYAYTPVTVDLIYGQSLGGLLTPYAGAGVSYNTTAVGGVSTSTAGAQGEVGLKFNLGGFSAGFEVRYLVPDLNKPNTGSTNYGGYATGSFSQGFNL